MDHPNDGYWYVHYERGSRQMLSCASKTLDSAEENAKALARNGCYVIEILGPGGYQRAWPIG